MRPKSALSHTWEGSDWVFRRSSVTEMFGAR